MSKTENSRRWWSEEDVAYLEKNWGRSSSENLCKTLKRTKKSIYRKASRLNLGNFTDAGGRLYTVTEVARMCGVHRMTVCNVWIGTCGLKEHRVGPNRKIDIDDLYRFMRNNPDRWNARKCDYHMFSQFKWFRDKWKEDDGKPDVKVRWSDRENAILKQMLHDGKTIEEIAVELGRSYDSVKGRMYVYNKRKWSDDETEKLLEYAADGYTWDEIAWMLGRTTQSVSVKLAKENLKK